MSSIVRAFLCYIIAVSPIHALSKPIFTDDCNKFHLTINKEPDYYVPRSNYIVGIESNYISYGFSTFRLSVRPLSAPGPMATLQSAAVTGWFSLLYQDSEVQFSPDAINTIIESTNATTKRSVYVLWMAPASRQCLSFEAELNYKTETGECVQKLDKKFCGISEVGLTSLSLPSSVSSNIQSNDEECCSCEEATYNLMFEGLWSEATHPKDFPPTLQLTHFSDIVGCSHSQNLTVWSEGQYATEGLRQVAEFGSSSILESELLDHKKHLRSLIKMSGLWYPRMNSNSTAKFRVNKRHNLLSLASMLGPSPDWFTGISKLNLCTSNCTWIESKIIDLPLFDAGTDSGISYMSPNAATLPQERIYRITSSYPEDPRAPFYSMHGDQIKPIARLYLRREKVVQKSCVKETMFDPNELDDSSTAVECTVTNYTNWSPCSASCGKGLQARTRSYVNSELAKRAACKVPLMTKKVCAAASTCPGETDDDSILLSDNQCKTGNWSEWSECTATCGIGFMTRTRRFFEHSSFKKCKHVSVYETKKCMEPPCKTTIVQKEEENCTTTEWSEWSPCSVSCGQGVRIRIRYLIVPPEMTSYCKERVRLEERRECIKNETCVIDKARAKDICNLALELGPCRGAYQRWHYESETKSCLQFQYRGCRGNENNFLSQDECVKFCSGI